MLDPYMEPSVHPQNCVNWSFLLSLNVSQRDLPLSSHQSSTLFNKVYAHPRDRSIVADQVHQSSTVRLHYHLPVAHLPCFLQALVNALDFCFKCTIDSNGVRENAQELYVVSSQDSSTHCSPRGLPRAIIRVHLYPTKLGRAPRLLPPIISLQVYRGAKGPIESHSVSLNCCNSHATLLPMSQLSCAKIYLFLQI